MSHWLLLLQTDKSGVALQIPPAVISYGMPEQAIDIELKPEEGIDDLFSSAQTGGEQAYNLLWREGYVREAATARFQFDNIPPHIIGQSADLAFSLAIISSILPRKTKYSAYAATGVLDEQGSVLSVEGIAEKIHAGLSAIHTQGIIFFPNANKSDISDELTLLANKQNIELCPVNRIDEVAVKLGIDIRKVYLDTPYRGLLPYTYEYRSIYFGRETTILEVGKKLLQRDNNGTPGLIIIAASGAGKSSFVQAGLIPLLVNTEQWLDKNHLKPFFWALSRPAAFGDLSNEAESCTIITETWKQQCPKLAALPNVDSWEQLAIEITEILPENQSFIWVLDQFEELFTLEKFESYSKSGSLDKFIKFLGQLQKNGIWLIATLRNDYYSQYQELSGLLEIFGDNGLYTLPDIDPAKFPAIINTPARFAELEFTCSKDNKIFLNDQIVDDLRRSTKALPFLSLTMELLFKNRKGNKLTFADYDAIGRIEGAIKTHTHNVETHLTTSNKKQVSNEQLQDILIKLVGLNAKGNRTFRISSLLDSFSKEEQFIIKQLIEARLLVTGNKNNKTTVELALDSLLTEWLQVKEVINRNKVLLQKKQRLIYDTECWQANDQNKRQLIDKRSDVIEAELLIHNTPDHFSTVTKSYVEKSMLKTRKQYRGLWLFIFFIFFIFFIEGIKSLTEDTSNITIYDIIPAIFMFMIISPFILWLTRTFIKKPYLLTIRKEHYTDLVLFIAFLIPGLIILFNEWYIQQDRIISIYSDNIYGPIYLIILSLSLLQNYIFKHKIISRINNLKDNTPSHIQNFFIKPLEIPRNTIIALNIFFVIVFLQMQFSGKTPSDYLFYYEQYINKSAQYVGLNNKMAESFLKKAENIFKSIPDDAYKYQTIQDQLYFYRIKARLANSEHNYNDMRENIKGCIEVGQELLDENPIQNLDWLLGRNLIKKQIENLNRSNNVKYSQALNQYAICIGRASEWYHWDDYPKAVLLNHKAIDLYKKAIKHAPDTDFSRNMAGQFKTLGDLYFAHKHFDDAIQAYDRSEEILLELKESNNANSYTEEKLIDLYRAKAEFYQTEFLKAENYLEKALTLSQKIYKDKSEKLDAFQLISEIKKEIAAHNKHKPNEFIIIK